MVLKTIYIHRCMYSLGNLPYSNYHLWAQQKLLIIIIYVFDM